MKKIFIILIFLPALLRAQTNNTIKSVTPVGAFFLNIPTGPRAFGMGNLTAASGEGYAASFSNPGRIPIGSDTFDENATNAYIAYTPIATDRTKNIHTLIARTALNEKREPSNRRSSF
ncbi:hypothetical protein [Pedobacter borealis]|uniref:hypothetical protein n=1 Tax=Pedobacter borealis TaxID=475254 RepID=UPI000493B4DA|nr:hypothetical protein [Pedobacter borealis]